MRHPAAGLAPGPAPSGRHALERLVIALAFVAGSTGFAAVAATLGAAVAFDNVPVLPVALLSVLAGGLFGSVAAAAASQRWWGFVLGLGLGMLVGAGAAGLGRWSISRVADGALAWGVQSFDAERWAGATTREDGFNPRGKMVASMLLSGDLEGTPRSDLHARLGAPDCAVEIPGVDAWAIGSWTGFQIAFDCLVVTYDADDRAERPRAVRPRAGQRPEPPLGTIAQLRALWTDAEGLVREAMTAGDPPQGIAAGSPSHSPRWR